MQLDPIQTKAVESVKKWYEECKNQIDNASSAPTMEEILTGKSPVNKRVALKNPRFVLSGSAGTGKSTVASMLFESLPSSTRIKFVTPTWKAAMVLKRKGVNNVQSIHSLIYIPVKEDGKLKFIKETSIEEPIDLLVVDEASMLNDYLIEDIEHFNIPVLYMGDHQQLPPVRGTNSLMKKPNVRLEKVYRQKDGSPILDLAYKGLNRGQLDYSDRVNFTDIFFDNINALKSADIILCATNKVRKMINKYMRKFVYNRSSNLPEVGDRLMGFKNAHDHGIINGEEYEVTYVGDEYKSLDVIELSFKNVYSEETFEKILVRTEPFYDTEIPEHIDRPIHLEYAYACSIHKSQGSQWDKVIYVNDWFPKDMNKMIYTAITRAAKKILVVSQPPKNYDPEEEMNAC